MRALSGLVSNCYETFGHLIDPEQFYTEENLERLGITVEDVEESLGFPRGWTCVEGSKKEIHHRLEGLKKSSDSTQVRKLLEAVLPQEIAGHYGDDH